MNKQQEQKEANIKSKCINDLIQHLNNHSQAWLKHDGFVWWTENEILSIAEKISKGELDF